MVADQNVPRGVLARGVSTHLREALDPSPMALDHGGLRLKNDEVGTEGVKLGLECLVRQFGGDAVFFARRIASMTPPATSLLRPTT